MSGMKITAVGRNIAVQANLDSSVLLQLRNIPGKKKWLGGLLLIEPTCATLDFIQVAFPSATWDAGAQVFLNTIAKIKSSVISAPVSAPRDYLYKTHPYDHQHKVFLLSRDLFAYALFMEQGTGKTKVIIDTAAYLWAKGLIRGLLVIAYPNGVHENWTRTEIPAHLPDWVQHYSVAWHGKDKPVDALYNADPSCLHILSINVEALSTKRGEEVCRKFLTSFPSMCAVDESTSIKTPGTKRTKAIIRLGAYAPYRRIMTGTPVTSGPLNLYSQFLFLDEEILGFGSYYSFRGRYAVMRPLPGRLVRGRQVEVVVGYQHEDELQKRIQAFSYRVLKKDCLDLPEKVYTPPIEVELTPEQLHIYKQYVDDAVAEFRGRQIPATMAITKMLRCHQVVCGFMPRDPQGNPDEMGQPLEGGNPRLEALIKQVEIIIPYDDASKQFGAENKMLIWAHYRYNIKQIMEALTERYGPGFIKPISSFTPKELRPGIVQEFQDHKSRLKVLVGNRAMAYGWTLTEAGYSHHYSNTPDLEVRSQSEDRPHRIGQKNNVFYTDYIAPGTVDVRFLKLLRGHYEVASTIVGDKITDWLLPKASETLFEK